MNLTIWKIQSCKLFLAENHSLRPGLYRGVFFVNLVKDFVAAFQKMLAMQLAEVFLPIYLLQETYLITSIGFFF